MRTDWEWVKTLEKHWSKVFTTHSVFRRRKKTWLVVKIWMQRGCSRRWSGFFSTGMVTSALARLQITPSIMNFPKNLFKRYTCLPDYLSFKASFFYFYCFIFFTGVFEIGCCLCFSLFSCLWIFLDAFPSRCPMPPHPGSDPRQTLNASQRHFQRASTIMLQLSRWTRWLLCSFSPKPRPLKSSQFCPFRKRELHSLFLCSLVLSIPFLAGALSLTNPPF